jgi:uncharacterized surface protein with fasciclin (FAS1) repeats
MKKFLLSTSMVVSFILIVSLGLAQEKQVMAAAKKSVSTPVVVEKANSSSDKQAGTIVDVIASSKAHTTLLQAVKTAGLVDALQGAGPFTVFAPTNDAFSKIPASTLDNLFKPEGKEALTKVLSTHVLNGSIKAEDILTAIKNGNGSATFSTLNGDKLTATTEAGKVKITDSNGNVAFVTTTSINADNGIIHVLDAVLIGK